MIQRIVNKGDIIGNLEIIRELPIDERPKRVVRYAECRCLRCGTVRVFSLKDVFSGKTRSCGACAKHLPARKYLTMIRIGMLRRCYNKKLKEYKWYGAKGVTVCDEWVESLDKFCNWALENGYKIGLTIDRIDNSKGYCPENCRFITIQEQEHNRSNNARLKGRLLVDIYAESPHAVSYPVFYARYMRGWDVNRALTTPLINPPSKTEVKDKD